MTTFTKFPRKGRVSLNDKIPRNFYESFAEKSPLSKLRLDPGNEERYQQTSCESSVWEILWSENKPDKCQGVLPETKRFLRQRRKWQKDDEIEKCPPNNESVRQNRSDHAEIGFMGDLIRVKLTFQLHNITVNDSERDILVFCKWEKSPVLPLILFSWNLRLVFSGLLFVRLRKTKQNME